jgi:hypothetical protein
MRHNEPSRWPAQLHSACGGEGGQVVVPPERVGK